MRILGFLVGAALVAMAAFAFGVRLPPLLYTESGDPGSVRARIWEPSEAATGSESPRPQPGGPTMPLEARVGGPGDEVPVPGGKAGTDADPEISREMAEDNGDVSPDANEAEPRSPAETGSPQWEAFFTPFRSQASADGFARFLQTATGRDFMVTRAGPGEYRVWVRVDSSGSSADRIAEIEAATGMTVRGGQL